MVAQFSAALHVTSTSFLSRIALTSDPNDNNLHHYRYRLQLQLVIHSQKF